MNGPPLTQSGASLLSNLVILALLGYCIFVAFQYVPQVLESRSVQTTLNSMLSAHEINPVPNSQVAVDRLYSMLNMSDLEGLASAFKVEERGGAITVSVRYERELDLLFTTQSMVYEKSVKLR